MTALFRLNRPVFPILAGVLLAATTACATPAPKVATSVPPAKSAAPAAKVVEWAAHDYGYTTPASVPGGLVTIRMTNHGQEPHHGQLVRLNDGVTFDQFTTAMQQEGEAALRFVTIEGGVGAIDPHRTAEVTLDLEPGQYALVCFIASPDGVPHLAKGMLQPLQVTETSAAVAAVPADQGTFVMKDFSFEMPELLPAGKGVYRVVNEGPQPHELNILKLAPGKKVDDVQQFLRSPAGAPPFEAVGGINGFDKNGGGFMTLDLTPGEYVAVCHIPDPASGLPHTHLGMVKAFSVR